MPASLLVLMTGLPAAGKSTTGRRLAEQLDLPFFDKDAVLETLFDTLGSPTPDDRTRLSRASDAVLAQLAEAVPSAVLSSFWRQPGMPESSGTSLDWVGRLHPARMLVEVECRCAPETAADRFLSRRRHPGHHDGRHTQHGLVAAFAELAAAGPVLDAEPVVVRTDQPVDVVALADEVSRRAAAGGRGGAVRPAQQRR